MVSLSSVFHGFSAPHTPISPIHLKNLPTSEYLILTV
nr:MAG TPA: hypothetical protein [Caudoviricetes sp.]